VESRRKALLRRTVISADPYLVPLLSATVVLLAAVACIFFFIYAINLGPTGPGSDPAYGNGYLNRSLILFAIAAFFAVLDTLAILGARRRVRMRPSVVVLPDDPTYHRSILTQQIPTGVALSAAWLTFNAVSAVAQGSWLHRAIAFFASLGIAASFIGRYCRSRNRMKADPDPPFSTTSTSSVGANDMR
jgi:hypothetical protein